MMILWYFYSVLLTVAVQMKLVVNRSEKTLNELSRRVNYKHGSLHQAVPLSLQSFFFISSVAMLESERQLICLV